MDLHYNAFISYRHHPQDIKVAETIHRSLERFRVPKALKKEGKGIDRIFRDKEELPITSSLTDTITTALRNSDYQIVICSTHLKGSYWVQREIETFLQTHTKDKILTVLVDGENPYDVIPEILTYNEIIDPVTGEVTREPIEPLSCDWRLPKRQAMKKELPRLAAVLLGCSYDDLIQRQKQYRQRRLLTGISIGMAGSLALAGYFLHTSIQIQESLNQSLRNHSQYLASASQERMAEGDRLTALALALEALPSEGNERPYVAAAEQALADALMLYQSEGQIISVASYDAESTIEDFAVTDDGHTLYIRNDQHRVSAWDTTSHQKLTDFDIAGSSALSPTMLTDNNGNLLVLGGESGTTLICRSREGVLLWEAEHIEDFAFTQEKECLLAIQSAPTGDLMNPKHYTLLQLNPTDGHPLRDAIPLFDYSTMHSPFFPAREFPKDMPIAVTAASGGAQQTVVTVNLKTKALHNALTYDTLFYGGTVTDDGRMYIMVSESSDSASGRLANYYYHTQAGAWVYCYDMIGSKELWRTAITSYGASNANTIASIPNSDRLFCQYGSAFLQLDAKNGKILAECHSTATPLTLYPQETGTWVLFSNGCAGTYTYATNTLGYIQYMENGLVMAENKQGIYVVPQLNSNVLLYRTVSDNRMEPYTGEYEDYIDTLAYTPDHLATYGMAALHLFDRNTRTLIWKADVGYNFTLLDFSRDGTTLFGLDKTTLLMFNTENGTAASVQLPMETENGTLAMYSGAVALAEDTLCLAAYETKSGAPYLLIYDCVAQTAQTIPFPTEEDSAAWKTYGNTPSIMHMDAHRILIRSSAGIVYAFDRNAGTIAPILTHCRNAAVFAANPEEGRMAFSTTEGIAVTDMQGTPIHIIATGDLFAVSLHFHGSELLCLGSDGKIHRYDRQGNHLSSTALSLYSAFFAQTNSIGSQKVPVTWAELPDQHIAVNVFRMGNIISTESWERTGSVPQMVLYNPATDRFLCQSNNSIFSYPRCSLEQTMEQARDVLGTFTLSETQRSYYGLNN